MLLYSDLSTVVVIHVGAACSERGLGIRFEYGNLKLLPIPLSISSKKKYCYLDPLVVFSEFLVTSSGDNCRKARPPRRSLLLSDTSCWSHHCDCVTWKLPVIAVLNRVFCLLSQQPGKGLNGQKRWSVQFLSSPLSFLRSRVCLAE